MPIVELGGGKVDMGGNMLGGEPITVDGINSTITVTHDMLLENNFERLEHLTVKIWVNYTRRGDVQVDITSPNGIRSVLAGPRPHDMSDRGFPGWTFSSIKHWDENPIGNWTIRIADQGTPNESGRFLGWTISLFGSSIDASAAVPYTLNAVTPSPGNPLPPVPPSVTQPGTKTHPKPTAHLPGQHGSKPGEADTPAFSPVKGTEDAVVDPTPDEGYFTGWSKLLKNSTWLIGAIGVVILFGIGATLFFWRRSRQLARTENNDYERVAPGEDVPMMDRGGTKELYDAFGEVSDDEADEETGLRQPMQSVPLGYHSEFLEDEDAPSPSSHVDTRYRDDPHPEDHRRGPASPGSNDDSSWEHASQQAKNE
ncbi:hypothetical protein M422DRAFT_270921 [Sphaerobolus stellatus SS14]|uniref:P/Homo B domain-containing protein n=1 Tax=Sphaerobolus stellatus (strain SS14) TaxID=990650 RepID=A0A0C9UR54_SPHS4|nr:hypothetical protein M422DRAFT_270921 [Sphaerobolus stellatus SS14]